MGTQTVANAILKRRDNIERFIHISTSEVYGTACKEVMDEEHPLIPMSPYAAAKAGADRLVYSYWATYEVPVVIVRPFNNYGPYQHLGEGNSEVYYKLYFG
jgi:dTDP-glucose 4,6-dehydratase